MQSGYGCIRISALEVTPLAALQLIIEMAMRKAGEKNFSGLGLFLLDNMGLDGLISTTYSDKTITTTLYLVEVMPDIQGVIQ